MLTFKAAFLLPMINTLLVNSDDLNTDVRPVKPECVILAPTRELAIQINREARLYSQNTIVKTVVCYGGASSVAQRDQLQVHELHYKLIIIVIS
jgi:superfamily II DNA/RNA helicase